MRDPDEVENALASLEAKVEELRDTAEAQAERIKGLEERHADLVNRIQRWLSWMKRGQRW